MKRSEPTPMTRGRPRAFDTEAALDAAMRVFWKHGFEGTSLADLEAATGLNRVSLYTAFGNKEALFHQVLDRYAAGPAAYLREAMNAPTARATVETLLFGAIDLLAHPDNPSACLIAQGLLTAGEANDGVRCAVAARRQHGQANLQARLDRAVTDGELPPSTDTAALAAYCVTVLRGLGVSANSGATRDELRGVAHMALRLWPTAGPQAEAIPL